MTSPYQKRLIKLSVTLGQGNFGESGFDTVVIENLRTTVDIEIVTGSGAPTCLVRVFGLTLDTINKITNAGLVWQTRANDKLIVEAGDSISGMSMVFNGDIFEAYPDFQNQPQVSFVLVGIAGRDLRQKPVSPTSIQGGVTAEQAFTAVANTIGVKLENNGVNGSIRDPYLIRTSWDQIDTLAKAFNCFWYLDTNKKVLSIWTKDGNRQSNNMITISPETGMIGYPEFQRNMILVKSLFLPTVEIGKQVKVQSQIPAASGTWNVVKCSHKLAAEFPEGPWETWVTGVRSA